VSSADGIVDDSSAPSTATAAVAAAAVTSSASDPTTVVTLLPVQVTITARQRPMSSWTGLSTRPALLQRRSALHRPS